jgi:hypothetical protein
VGTAQHALLQALQPPTSTPLHHAALQRRRRPACPATARAQPILHSAPHSPQPDASQLLAPRRFLKHWHPDCPPLGL